MPNPIQNLYINTPSGQIHARRVEGPGDPVILLHRTPIGSSCFAPMLRLLAGTSAAIALDTPGFGQSFTPDFSPTAADYAAWFLAALDAAGITRFHICAHHTGTHFGVELACLAPARAVSLCLNGVLYATQAERDAMRAQIGTAPPPDEAGDDLLSTWSLIKSLFPHDNLTLCRREFAAALASPTGRDQAFNAIFQQDFPAALVRVKCPIAIVQASDDPLNHFLPRVRAAHPEIPVEVIGPAGLAAPELQPEAYVGRLLNFITTTHQDQP